MPPVDEVVDRGDEVVPPTPPTPPEEQKVEDVVKDVAAKAPDKAAESPEKGEEAADRDEKGRFIPRERFNEAVEKERKKAEVHAARAAELESQLQAQTASQDIVEAQKLVKELVKQRNSNLADGKLDEASEIDNKIFELQEAIAERKADAKVEQGRAQAVETMKYDAVVERLENDHPEINPDSDSYDEDAATELRALMRGYQTELRLTPSEALKRAAKRFFAVATPAKEEVKVSEEGVRRKAEATARNVEAANKQPPAIKDVGLDHDKKGGGLDAKTVMNMKYDEFIKLGDDVLAKLRGDAM